MGHPLADTPLPVFSLLPVSQVKLCVESEKLPALDSLFDKLTKHEIPADQVPQPKPPQQPHSPTAATSPSLALFDNVELKCGTTGLPMYHVQSVVARPCVQCTIVSSVYEGYCKRCATAPADFGRVTFAVLLIQGGNRRQRASPR